VRYFVAVAEELHFHRAAEKLHIAQPSLSHQIRALERQLGVVLLTRTSRRVELTPAGRVLLEEGRELLDRAQGVVVNTRHAVSEEVTIGFYGSAALKLLPVTMHEFQRQHPSTQTTVRELLFGNLDDLTEGRVDVAFTRLRPDQVHGNLRVEVLAREPRVLAVAATHPLSARDSVRFAELHADAFITNPAVKGRPLVRWLAEQQSHGLKGNIAAEAGSLQELLTLVATGRGVSLVPHSVKELFPRPDLRYITVTDAEPALISIAWRPTEHRPIVEVFVDLARRAAASSQEGARHVSAAA
jgi:DNA-binding transcriptional LysR family regulator